MVHGPLVNVVKPAICFALEDYPAQVEELAVPVWCDPLGVARAFLRSKCKITIGRSDGSVGRIVLNWR